MLEDLSQSLRRLVLFAVAVLLAGSFVMAAGCQSHVRHQDSTDAQPDYDYRPRALVMDSPELRAYTAFSSQTQAASGQPWYASRNDARRTVSAGLRGATIDRQVTITHDRQTTTAGRTRDHFSSTTHGVTVTHTVR